MSPIEISSSVESDDIRCYIDEQLENALSGLDLRNSYSISSYHPVCPELYDLAVDPRASIQRRWQMCMVSLMGSNG